MKDINKDILDIKVRYNIQKLNSIEDEELLLIENKIYGDKSDMEKIILELKCIMEHLKKMGKANEESLEQLLSTLTDMPSLSLNATETLKRLVSIIEIHLNMDYGFYKSVKHSGQDDIEKVKKMSL